MILLLDRLEQIIQDREQQKQQQQQEQQRCTDATKSQQATTVPQLNVVEEGVERDGGAGHRDNFSPDRTRSPSPRLTEKRQQQYQWTQQSSFGTSTAGGQDQAWKLREKLLETGKKMRRCFFTFSLLLIQVSRRKVSLTVYTPRSYIRN